MKRVLVFTNLFPSQAEPTRGLFNLRGFRALADHCDIHVVASLPGWQRLRWPEQWLKTRSEVHQGIPATYPPYWSLPRAGVRFHAQAMYACVHRHVRSLHHAHPFDAILGAYAYPDLATAARLADTLHLPLVGFVLGSDINELAQRSTLRPQIQAALRRCSSVIAVSRGLRDRVVELGIPGDRVIVQYNGVEGDVFAPRDRTEARAQLGVPSSQPLVCFVGNLVPEKGPDLLVRALAQTPGVHAVVIGGGPLRASLEAEAEALGVSSRLRFLGRQPAAVVAQWLAAADLLCLSSRREGCPNVVLEALASGRPVVGTAVGGVPELVTSSNGVLAPSEDPDGLAQAIREALTRAWEPEALRASVPSLSWADLGRTLYAALESANTPPPQN